MTVSTIDYRSESAAAPIPVLAGALMGMLTVVLVWQCIVGGMGCYSTTSFAVLRAIICVVFGCAVAALPILAVGSFLMIRGGSPASASAMGRFLRISAYTLALSLVTTLGRGPGWVTAVRAIVELGLLAAVFVAVQRSQPIRQTCGRTFPARVADAVFRMVAGDGALVVLLMLASLVCVLTWSARGSMKAFGLHFLSTSEWRPNDLEVPVLDAKGHPQLEFNEDQGDYEPVTRTVPPVFGALPVIYGTIMSSAIALLLAVPLSLGAALFLVRVVPRVPAGMPRAALSLVSFLIEFLAAIPSIAYGIWGLFMLAPFLSNHLEPPLNRLFGAVPGPRWLHTAHQTTGNDMLCGGIVLAIMILPIITAISRDVLFSVPRTQIEGSLALGATWWQSSWGMLRYGKSGLFGAVMLGLARAAGETMAVAMVIGDNSQIKASWFEPAQTMASLIANEFHDASDLHESSLVEVALILLVMSLAFNILARWLVVGGKRMVAI